MTRTIARRTSLALTTVAVTMTALFAAGGSASAATAASGDGSASVSDIDGSASVRGTDSSAPESDSDRATVSRHLKEICRQVERDGGLEIRLADHQGYENDARSRWIADQILWVCSHV